MQRFYPIMAVLEGNGDVRCWGIRVFVEVFVIYEAAEGSFTVGIELSGVGGIIEVFPVVDCAEELVKVVVVLGESPNIDVGVRFTTVGGIISSDPEGLCIVIPKDAADVTNDGWVWMAFAVENADLDVARTFSDVFAENIDECFKLEDAAVKDEFAIDCFGEAVNMTFVLVLVELDADERVVCDFGEAVNFTVAIVLCPVGADELSVVNVVVDIDAVDDDDDDDDDVGDDDDDNDGDFEKAVWTFVADVETSFVDFDVPGAVELVVCIEKVEFTRLVVEVETVCKASVCFADVTVGVNWVFFVGNIKELELNGFDCVVKVALFAVLGEGEVDTDWVGEEE